MLLCDETSQVLLYDFLCYVESAVESYTLSGIHVIPGAWYLEKIYWAVNQIKDNFSLLIVNDFLVNRVPIISGKSKGLNLIVEVLRKSDHQLQVSFFERYYGGYSLSVPSRVFGLDVINNKNGREIYDQAPVNLHAQRNGVNLSSIYAKMVDFGVLLSGEFNSLDLWQRNNREVIYYLRPTKSSSQESGIFAGQYHAIFQALTFYLAEKALPLYGDNRLLLPAGFSGIEIRDLNSVPYCVSICTQNTSAELILRLLDSNGQVIVCIAGCRIKEVGAADFREVILNFLQKDSLSLEHIAIATNLFENVDYFIQNKMVARDKISLVAAIIFLWASKIVPWSKS